MSQIPDYINKLIAKGIARPRQYTFQGVGAGSLKVPDQSQIMIYNIKYHHFVNRDDLMTLNAEWRLYHQLRISGEKTSSALFHTRTLVQPIDLGGSGSPELFIPREDWEEFETAVYFEKGFINFEIALASARALQVAGDPPRKVGIVKTPNGYDGLNTPRALTEQTSGTSLSVLPFTYEATKENPPTGAPYSNTFFIPYNDQTQVKWINTGDGYDVYRLPLVHISYVEIDKQADFLQKGKL